MTEHAAPSSKSRRTALLASGAGTIIEWYDYVVYGFVAVTMATLFFDTEDPGSAVLYSLAVFGVSFLCRPLGGVIFGHIADRYGRRPALTISVIGIAVFSALMGFLPVYGHVGILAPILLVILRAIQGVAAGGELASAAVYASEASDVKRRGFDVSVVLLCVVIGTTIAATVSGILYGLLSEEQMLSWGWRVPFWLSIPMGLAAWMFRRKMEESVEFVKAQEAEETTRSPILKAFSAQPRSVILVTVMSVGSLAAYYITFTYLITYFRTQGLMTATQASWSTVIALVISGTSIPFWGKISDRIGRKPIFVGSTLGLTLLAYPMFVLMNQGFAFALFAQITLGLFEAAYLSVLLTAPTEIFRPAVRVSGLALAYNLAAVASGGIAPYVSQWLIKITKIVEAPAFFLTTAALLSLIAATFFYEETGGKPLPGQNEEDRKNTNIQVNLNEARVNLPKSHA
ncbi:MFS transporter [Rhodococcus sp. KBW08]|uniref:MFS transporter n=1 Tax=Rhodococcus sp. KBW08 TaxID=2144188 RepID=UPI001C89E157|nr:MFS transporter [Rhodococcus sp. KBW08]